MTTANKAADFEIVRGYTDRATEGAWRDFLCRVELPSHYVAPAFFLEPYWDDKQPFAVLARQDGRITGVATGIHEDGELVSGNMYRPQICIDRTADPALTADALARGLLAEARGAKLVTVFGWRWIPLHALEKHGFRRRETVGDVVLDLTLGPDALFRGFDHRRRNGVRQAIKKGVEVCRASTPDDFRMYYEVIQRWQNTPRKQIMMGGPFDVFQKAAFLKENRCIFLAKFAGKVIAGAVLRFYPGGLLEYSANASLEEFLNLKPNDLLQWRVIEWACREGFRRYSFGSAAPFVRKFGGEIVPIDRYRLDRTWLRRCDLHEAILDLSRDCLRKLPAPVEKWVRLCLGRH